MHLGAPLAAPEDTPLARREWNDHLHELLVELSGRHGSDRFAPVGGAA